MERSIVEVARAAGTTSRTLRHYDEVGLLPPTRIGANGYHYYDESALLRLQRILLLRDLGLGIPAIAEVLAGELDDARALATHLELLEAEQDRLRRQIVSVAATLDALQKGERLMPDQMFDGFDHTQYKDEVVEAWGADAYRKSDAWWRAMSKDEQRAHQQAHRQIAGDYRAAQDAGRSPDSETVRAIVARHVAWLNLAADFTGGPITPTRLTNYGDMYVSDPRFAKNYGGASGAEFVRDAFVAYAHDWPTPDRPRAG